MRSGALKVNKLTVPWERCHEEWSSKGKQTNRRGAMKSGTLKVNKLYPGRGAMRSGALKVNKPTGEVP